MITDSSRIPPTVAYRSNAEDPTPMIADALRRADLEPLIAVEPDFGIFEDLHGIASRTLAIFENS